MRYKVKCGEIESNGLKFYTQYDSSSTRELAVIAIRAGSFCDPPNRRGLSHLVEHVVCAESKTHSREEVDLLLARATGGHDDGLYITTDCVATTYGYFHSLHKVHARKLFRMFANMVKDTVFTKTTLETEKAAVHHEHYLRGRDIAEIYILEILQDIIFPKTFLARVPIDGRMGEVRSATLEDIRRHLETYYVPANTCVIYIGPKHDEVREIVRKEFGDWGVGWKKGRNKAPSFTLPRGNGGFQPLDGPRKKRVSFKGIHQYHVAIGFPTETYMSDDAEALDILANIVSSRMYHELRTENTKWKKGAYRVPVYAERTFAHGLFVFQFATLDESFAFYGIDVFKKLCHELSAVLVKRNELESWVGYMRDYGHSDYFSRDPSGLMELIATAVSNGDTDLARLHGRENRLLAYLKRGGRHKLRDVARKYFSGHNATVVLRPK